MVIDHIKIHPRIVHRSALSKRFLSWTLTCSSVRGGVGALLEMSMCGGVCDRKSFTLSSIIFNANHNAIRHAGKAKIISKMLTVGPINSE